MYEQHIRDKIASLCIENDIAESKLSKLMGHSDSYIRGITSGRNMISLGELLYICEYFHITPDEFFRRDRNLPLVKRNIIEDIVALPVEDAEAIAKLIERLKAKQE